MKWFFVCEYRSPKDWRGRRKYSGKFPCLGDTREQAEADAVSRIESMSVGPVEYVVRRASILEVLFG